MKSILDNSQFKTRTRTMYNSQKKRAHGQLPFTLEILRRQLAAYLESRPLCPYCNCLVSLDNVSLDHLWPIARGGTFDSANTHFICKPCNVAKGQFKHREYQALLSALDDLGARFNNHVIRDWIVNALKISHSFRQGVMRRQKVARQSFKGRALN